MTYDILGPGALDYLPCRYGTSKLTFRGPRRVLEAPYVAFLGGTVTFGKFIEQPFPLRVEHLTGVTSVNFGQVNAGLDVFAKDACVLEAAAQAHVTVMEVTGAANVSNRFYSVHPRRNDRFLHPMPDLRQLYYDVDFTQFSFTHHMLQHLKKKDPLRFAEVRHVLQRTWVRRMRRLLPQLSREVVLLRVGLQNDSPVMVVDDMIDRLGSLPSAVVDIPSTRCVEEGIPIGMAFNLLEEEAAKAVPQPHVHAAIAQALCPVLDRLM
ncbi:DUF6473 family protein [uncultured Sulfitobacter sp.]|uniref:DUF6473 family protein n=1 Tax=uncultured Sulfitobacter sp. TaxID=191468 RepID=UPI00261D62E9|nr:DUF6473 family protein [uncultured Sulfitobacter sp.]